MHFLEWKCLHLDWNFTDVCSHGFNWQYSSIGSIDGLAPNRRQAVIWTIYVLGCRRIYSSFGLIELIQKSPQYAPMASVNNVSLGSGDGLTPNRLHDITGTNDRLMAKFTGLNGITRATNVLSFDFCISKIIIFSWRSIWMSDKVDVKTRLFTVYG